MSSWPRKPLVGQRISIQGQRPSNLEGAAERTRRHGRQEETELWALVLANIRGGGGSDDPTMCFYSPIPYLRSKLGLCEPISNTYLSVVLATTVDGREGLTYN